jgi:zinc transporter
MAGLMGMNVGGIPFAEDPRGFWFVAGGVLSATGAAALWFFSRRR